MKTGLGLYKKYRFLIAGINLYRFWLRKKLIGFDVANIFIQRVDKYSLILILKKNGATIGDHCDIETSQVFHNCKDYSNFYVGNNCHIGKNCFFDLRDSITISDNVVISMNCTFITHIDMSKAVLREIYPTEKKSIVIMSNAYIGVNSTLLMGIQIGQNSFIAAGSLITKNVEPDSLVGGIPARQIKNLY